MAKYTSIGGQALIEGIMMKSPEKTALAVRMPDKSIDITYLNGKGIRERYKILRVPVIRGVAGFVESMIQGYKAMMMSADKSGFTDLEEEDSRKAKAETVKETAEIADEQENGAVQQAETEQQAGTETERENPDKQKLNPLDAQEVSTEQEAEPDSVNENLDKQESNPYGAQEDACEQEAVIEIESENLDKRELNPSGVQQNSFEQKAPFAGDQKNGDQKTGEKKNNALMSVIMVIATVLGVALAVILFMLLPRLAVSGLRLVTGTDFSPVVRSSIEQLLKLAIFVAYVWAVSFMKDIKRVFMYHGAEHKTIFCYEKGLPLTVDNVRVQRRFHPRCGTSFMILMILISIVFSTLVQIIFPAVYNAAWLWVAIKILLIPVVCGAGFEVLKICGKYDNLATRIISAPGLWLQRITTKEPDDGMIEVAIAALKACEPKVPDVDRSVDRAENQPEKAADGTE